MCQMPLCVTDGGLQASPEFKGIKTHRAVDKVGFLLQASPEFKGIKTQTRRGNILEKGFKPALNSKGLRLSASVGARVVVSASSQP